MKNADLPILEASDSLESSTCCRWASFLTLRSLGGAVLSVITLGAVLVATYFAGVAQEARQAAVKQAEFANWQGLPIANAVAAVSSEKFSMATGPISEQGEALFVLDHNSGLLQCSVLYPRLAKFMASFTVNVSEALGLDAKGGQYIMCTGTADFPRSSNQPVGMSVVYVLDSASGNYACYGVPFDRIAMNANRPQQNSMVLLHQGTANPLIDRDELR